MAKKKGKHIQEKKKKLDKKAIKASNDADKTSALDSLSVSDNTAFPSSPSPSEGVGAPASNVAPIEDSSFYAPAPNYAPNNNVSQEGGFIPDTLRKKRSKGKIIGIIVAIFLGILLIAYIAGAVVFSGRFFPNTYIGEHNISMKTDAEVAAILNDTVEGYALGISGGSFNYKISGSDVKLDVDVPRVIKNIHADLNTLKWPLFVFQKHYDGAERVSISFNFSLCEPGLRSAIEQYNKTAKPPVDATIAYDAKTRKFTVKPEEKSSMLNPEKVIDAAKDSLMALNTSLVLTDEYYVQPNVLSTDPNLAKAAEYASGMVSANITLLANGEPIELINGEMLSRFIYINDKHEVVFEEAELDEWINDVISRFNTVGTERTYTREDGKNIVVSGGSYGWKADNATLKEDILENVRTGSTVQIEIPFIEKGTVFGAEKKRDWGKRYIDVDLAEQHVRFYDDKSVIIWEADCISGIPDGKHDTVQGVWKVNAKESPSKLIGYENGKKIYETTVTYWMPFESNSIGFHDATWQPSFGGSMYRNGYGSHGCVNLSLDKARSLYELIKVGDVVVVHT